MSMHNTYCDGCHKVLTHCQCREAVKPHGSEERASTSEGLSLLLEEVKHLYKCYSESIDHDDITKNARYYRRGHRDAYSQMIESIKRLSGL